MSYFLNIDLSSFNSKDEIQFTPTFNYNTENKKLSAVSFQMPAFPLLLKTTDTKAQSTSTAQIDSKIDVSNQYKIVGFKNPLNQKYFEVFLEGKWFYPYYADGKTKTKDWNKTGVADVSASSLNNSSIMLFTASPSSLLSSLNNKFYKINNVSNSKPAVTTVSLPTTGSVVLRFNIDITTPSKSGATSSDPVGVNPNVTEVKDYIYYEKYDIWKLSITNSNYAGTLNNTKYIRDVPIFSYSTDGGITKYLVQPKNSRGPINITPIDVTSNLPSYSDIQSYYINAENNPKMSIQTRIYTNILTTSSIKFYVKTIRYKDANGTSTFTNAEEIDEDQKNWVQLNTVAVGAS